MSDTFWTARPALQHVCDFARGRRVCPWSTLGVVLVRAVCHIPPHVYLPPLVGGRTSVNLFCALVGPSGVGKGGSESAGRDAITYTNRSEHGEPYLTELPLGSGEGISRTFSGDDTLHTALFTAPEIDSLAALFARQGSTLEGELRKVWMGETLGFTNSDKKTRTFVERLSYRAGMIVGVQPLRAHTLLDGADGGTPQRFIWMPVLDPQRPTERPETPDPITLTIPEWMPGDLEVPEIASRAIDEHQAAIHAQDPNVDPLSGHALLCRLKVACGLMILDSRAELQEDDWDLAGHVMAVSNHTRQGVQQATRDKARQTNRARAHAVADRDEIVSDRKLHRAKEAVIRWLGNSGELAARDLRPKLKADIRDYFDAALAELADAGQIHVTEVANGRRYRLTPEVHAVPEVQPPNPQFRDAVPEVQHVPPRNVTDLDTRRSHDPARPKLSCQKWFNKRIDDLRAAGHTTASSFAVYAEGQAAGYSRQQLRTAASSHPDIAVIDRTRGQATWNITGTHKGPYRPAAEWAVAYFDHLVADGERVVDKERYRAAAAAAGHSWTAVRHAAVDSGRIESVRGEAQETIWVLNTGTADSTTEGEETA